MRQYRVTAQCYSTSIYAPTSVRCSLIIYEYQKKRSKFFSIMLIVSII